MAEILVTGGTGRLGRELVPRLVQAGHRVRVLTRAAPQDVPTDAVPIVGDLRTGAGLREAIAGAEVIVHAASSPWRDAHATEVDGSRRLLEAAKASGTGHFVYVSIVGVDRVPLPYYRAKFEAERLVAAAGVPYTVQRATQFHEFVVEILATLGRGPLLPSPFGAQLQPIDAGEVADLLVARVAAGPGGRVADAGGPEVRAWSDLARSWLRAAGRKAWLIPLPAWGSGLAAVKDGALTCPHGKVGKLTFEDHLRRAYGS
ncbi:MAG: NAD-dependent epimerase/dehydratase family protein [Myxococcales bacterium]|nr:NAD-dependent epimerase/dehydratase family protein [Myxococcales bacterium]